ncbi:MAG: ADP-ribosylglycohydrolase family protein [Myxococcales bacterium]|nr:ADP-ribosylglycohydrolase family protein [Myxococcales bacterium]
MTPRERMQLSLEGLSLGDAFGERFFGPPGIVTGRIAAREVPPGPWAWTDDTAMALSLCEVLEAHGAVERDALAQAFARRFATEPMRGYGGGARDILTEIGRGTPWELAAGRAFDGQGSLGNGGAMRAAPVGAYFAEDLARVVEEARRSAEVTHAHADGQAGAIAVAVAAALVVRGADGPSLLRETLAHVPSGETRDALARALEVPLTTSPEVAAERLGSGARVLSWDTVPFSLWCAARHLDDFEAALWCTVAGLGDRDTTCAIVGGVVALRVGQAGLPAAWLTRREALPGRAG